jgi:hypothetical protein
MFPVPLSDSIHNKNLIRTITADDDTVIILSVKLSFVVTYENTKSEKPGKGYKRLENRKFRKAHTLKYEEKRRVLAGHFIRYRTRMNTYNENLIFHLFSRICSIHGRT